LRAATGVGAFIHHLAAALADPDLGGPGGEPVEVTLFSSSWKDRLGPVADRGLPAAVAAIDRRIPVRLLNVAWHRAEWPPIEALTGLRFDVVHSPHPLLLPSRRAAQVVTICDVDFLDHPERAWKEIRRDYPALARRHALRAAHVVVPSHYTAGQVARHLGVPRERIAVCPCGATSWTPRPAAPEGGHLLFVGSLAPRKNVGGLLAAYARLTAGRARVPDLVLAGGAPEGADAEWRRALDDPRLAGRVRRTGYVDAATLQSLYAGACALVLPSLDEGFGLPALEAMTLGVPVVASDRGALPEVVGEAGLLVDPTDPAALADALGRILDEPELGARCAARGPAQARMFDWRSSARTLRAAYRQAIETRIGGAAAVPGGPAAAPGNPSAR
jgi:glycosyltransferase involved in cell wall biosynthesis